MQTIVVGFDRDLAAAESAANAHLGRYLTTGKLLHAVRFDREAEAQQILAHRATAASKLAEAWRK